MDDSVEEREFPFLSQETVSYLFEDMGESVQKLLNSQQGDSFTQIYSRGTEISYSDSHEEQDMFQIDGESILLRQPQMVMWNGAPLTVASQCHDASNSTFTEQASHQSTSIVNCELSGPSDQESSLDQESALVMADSSPSSVIPSNKPWPGPYNFNMVFQEQPAKMTKSTSWTFSETLEKLFINMGYSCIVSFKVDNMPPAGCIIRALPIFEKAEHIIEVVKRCPTHSQLTDLSNVGHPAPDHLVRCDNDLAQYVTEGYSLRQSVIVPFEPPQAGADNSEYLYKFMCFGSCVGGLNRRPLMLIFTLEKDGVVLGRRTLRVRICACPGRDRRSEEKSLEARSQKLSGTTPASSNRVINQTTTTEIISIAPPPNKRLKTDDDVFTLTVKGRKNYEILMNVKQALELSDLVPRDAVQAYHKEQLQLNGATSCSANTTCSTSSLLQQQPGLLEQANTSALSIAPFSVIQNRNQETAAHVPNKISRNIDENCAVGHLSSDISPKISDAVKKSSQIKVQPVTSVESWLDSIGMAAYVDVFEKRNLTDMSQLDALEEDDLLKLHIGESHRQAIWTALQERNGLISGSQPLSQASTFSGLSQYASSTGSAPGQPAYLQISRYRFKRVKSFKSTDQT